MLGFLDSEVDIGSPGKVVILLVGEVDVGCVLGGEVDVGFLGQ